MQQNRSLTCINSRPSAQKLVEVRRHDFVLSSHYAPISIINSSERETGQSLEVIKPSCAFENFSSQRRALNLQDSLNHLLSKMPAVQNIFKSAALSVTFLKHFFYSQHLCTLALSLSL